MYNRFNLMLCIALALVVTFKVYEHELNMRLARQHYSIASE